MRRFILFSFLLLFIAPLSSQAQGSKIYLQPEIGLGIVTGYDHTKALSLDFANLNKAIHLELRGGYNLNPGLSLFTGFGYCAYRYRMVVAPLISGPDTIRTTVYQDCYEVPIGIRVATYYGQRSFKTRFYGAAGLRACFLSDARHNYRAADGSAGETNVVRDGEYNSFWVRAFAEGGLDIPMDYNTAILIGLQASHGLTRNMSTDGALINANYGVLLIGGSIGLRLGL